MVDGLDGSLGVSVLECSFVAEGLCGWALNEKEFLVGYIFPLFAAVRIQTEALLQQLQQVVAVGAALPSSDAL